MLPRPCAGHVEQSALGFVDVVQLRLVGGVSDAPVERKDAFVARHHRDGEEFESPLARLIGAVVISAAPVRPATAARARVANCGVRTKTPISPGANSVGKPSLDGLSDCVRLRGDCVECLHLGRPAVEDRDDPAPLVF